LSKNKFDAIITFKDDMSAENVTGSCTYVELPNTNILLECGSYQGKGFKTNYKINNRNFKFKVKDLDYVILLHAHIDHIGLVPRLIKEGFNGEILLPEGNIRIMKEMLSDGAYLNGKEAEALSRREKGNKFLPTFTQEHVDVAIELMREIKFNERETINYDLDIEFFKSGHIINSGSLMIYLNHGSNKKIFYTSDMGSDITTTYYSDKLDKIDSATVVLSECTYSSKDRQIKSEFKDKDIEKMHAVVDEAIKNNSTILIPAFSLNRTQDMVGFLCDNKINEKIDIYVDSPLSYRISDIYKGKYKEFNENSKKVKWVVKKEDSMALMKNPKPHIIISASGMMVGGRVIHHLKNIIENSKNTVVFCGFAVDNTLASKIKKRNQKTIKIYGEKFKNNANVVELKSFSSHIQRKELIDYLSSIHSEKIVLKHGNKESKVEFSKDLMHMLSHKCNTARVICPNKNTKIKI